jgi:hypothetical protein
MTIFCICHLFLHHKKHEGRNSFLISNQTQLAVLPQHPQKNDLQSQSTQQHQNQNPPPRAHTCSAGINPNQFSMSQPHKRPRNEQDGASSSFSSSDTNSRASGIRISDELLRLNPSSFEQDVSNLGQESIGKLAEMLKSLATRAETLALSRPAGMSISDTTKTGSSSSVVVANNKESNESSLSPSSGDTSGGDHGSGSDDSDQTDVNSGEFPSEVLRQVCQSMYLTAEEMGRLLLFSCRGFVRKIGSELVWEYLTLARWRSSSELPESLIQKRGYKWLFQQLLKGVHTEANFTNIIPPTTLQSNQVIFLVTVRRGNDELVSEQFTFDQVVDMQANRSSIRIQVPIALGTFRVEGEFVQDFFYNFRDWKATVHCIRLDTNECCCVHQTRETRWSWYGGGCIQPEVPSLYEVGGTGNVKMGFLQFCAVDDEMTNLEMGRIQESLLRGHSRRSAGIDTWLPISPILDYYTTGFEHTGNGLRVRLSAIRMSMIAWQEYTNEPWNQGDRETNGKAFLKLISELKGWKKQA